MLNDKQPSAGHLLWFSRPCGQVCELYRDTDGEIYTAASSNVLDVSTMNRIGRWEGPGRMQDALVAQFRCAECVNQ